MAQGVRRIGGEIIPENADRTFARVSRDRHPGYPRDRLSCRQSLGLGGNLGVPDSKEGRTVLFGLLLVLDLWARCRDARFVWRSASASRTGIGKGNAIAFHSSLT